MSEPDPLPVHVVGYGFVVQFRIPEPCLIHPDLANIPADAREKLIRDLVATAFAAVVKEMGLDRALTGIARSLFGHVAQIERLRRSLGLPPNQYHFRG